MIRFEKISDLRKALSGARNVGKKIGVVPTMGALHEGHLSLVRIAKEHSDIVVMTIFVNPTQFAPHEDFAAYPRDTVRDARLAEQAGVDLLFLPAVEEMYPDGFSTFVTVEGLTRVLEGSTRPTHFRGVTTIVSKLLHITAPEVAVFGQKDAQQAAVIRRMVRDLNMNVDILIGPIIREPDGLAMSSRNAYLSPEERRQSTVLSRSLRLAEDLVGRNERSSSVIIKEMKTLISAQGLANIDYVSVADYTTLQEIPALEQGRTVLISLAVRFGRTRLIDNCLMTLPAN